DAAVDDVARSIHRAADRLCLPGPGRGQHDARRVDDVDVPVALAGQPGALRLGEQPFARGVELRLVADEETDLAARVRQFADRDVVVGPAFAAHRGTHRL